MTVPRGDGWRRADRQVGSAADEAVRLLAAAQAWAVGHLDRLDDEHLATGSPACTVCPLCQAVTAVRAVRPETLAHLSDAVGSLAAALRSAVAAPPGPPEQARYPGVHRIDLDDDPDPPPSAGSGTDRGPGTASGTDSDPGTDSGTDRDSHTDSDTEPRSG